MTGRPNWPFWSVAEPGAAASRWAEAGHVPLEVLAETVVPAGPLRIAAPGRAGWMRTGGTWLRVPPEPVLGVLAAAPLSACSVELLLAERHTGRVLTTLAQVEAPTPWTVTGWMGWPDLRPGGAHPLIDEALSTRSNDYWALDLAAEAVGFGPMDTFSAQPLPWRAGVSVVLPARGVHDVLPGVLHAVAESASRLLTGTPWEAIVVDDASEPPLRLPSGLPPQVRLIRSETQLHCGGARNHGIALARHGLIVFCDADTHLAPGYLTEHIARHLLTPNAITVSLRDHVSAHQPVPDRAPDGSRDSRVTARYGPDRMGLVPVREPITVHTVAQTRSFREFGFGRLVGPVDLPFMVKGNNLVLAADTARSVRFPPDFTGWGPEDVCFAAKAIARGAYVVPVLSTGVFHCDHPPRSGDNARRCRRRVNRDPVPAGGL